MSNMLAKGFAVALALAATLLSAAPGRADDTMRNEFYRSMTRGGGGDEPAVLRISGMIGPGYYATVRDALDEQRPTLVVLEGPGGSLYDALLIAEEIRRRQLDTLVRQDQACASACAVVFLSGRNKYLGAGALIGLHAASFLDGRAAPDGTALMAAYLSEVGVPAPTLRRMARTAPSDIRWLTRAEQKAIGIRAYSGG